MSEWLRSFRYDPLAPLLECEDAAIRAFARRDLLDEAVSAEDLWQMPEPRKILRKQRPDGSWLYPGAKETIRTQENYDQIETYRNLGFLVEEFGLDRQHPAIARAAEFLFSFQSDDGDLRGIYGSQYSPNYTAGITELLVKAGYANDARTEKVFEWLLSIRQDDGGWAIPFRTRDRKLDVIVEDHETIEPDRSRPFSHMVTGVVLRAFAAHPAHGGSSEAEAAGELLLSAIFKKDRYPDRARAEYWLRFSFPFWFTDLVSALDSLSRLGFAAQEPRLEKALQWFVENQKENGLWEFKILKGTKKDIIAMWLALAVCGIFRRFYGD